MAQQVRPMAVELEGHHSGTAGHQGPSQRSGPRADIDDQVAVADAGGRDDLLSPPAIELVPPPPRGRGRGHDGP